MTFQIMSGQFTSDGALRNISLPPGYDEFRMVNITDIGSAAAVAGIIMRAQGTSAMLAGSAYYSEKTNGAATLNLEQMTLTNGFTFVANSARALPSAAVAITGITNAAPPVVATGSTAGLSNLDIVRVYSTTGQLNIAGMEFTIDTIVANTSFNLAYMAAPGAAATAGFWRRIPFDYQFYPRNRYITKILRTGQLDGGGVAVPANTTRITLSVTHGYTVDQFVTFTVPSEFGMTQMDQITARITAIGNVDVNNTTNTIDVAVDSTAFTAFAFPTSAIAAGGVTFAQIYPAGEFATTLLGAVTNTAFTGIQIGTTVQTTGKVYQWFAYKGVVLP